MLSRYIFGMNAELLEKTLTNQIKEIVDEIDSCTIGDIEYVKESDAISISGSKAQSLRQLAQYHKCSTFKIRGNPDRYVEKGLLIKILFKKYNLGC